MRNALPNPSSVLPAVFVGCSVEGLPVAKAIQNNLQYAATTTIWRQGQFELTHTVLEDLVSSARRSDFAVFVLFPDDLVRSRGQEQVSPRDNTIFETGLFMGILGRNRILLVVPHDVDIKLPSDLAGLTVARYKATPPDDRWEPVLGPATNQIEDALKRRGRRVTAPHASTTSPGPHHVYPNLKHASRAMSEACRNASDIKVWANKGLVFLGTDDAIISTAEIHLYKRLRKLRVLLMSPDSRWIAGQPTPDGPSTKRLITLRKHESLETYLKEIEVCHRIVESGFQKFSSVLSNARSGVRYFKGEPCWRMVMTEDAAFVSNYADDSVGQTRDLAVLRFDNVPGSLYCAFKRQFNDIWHNESVPASFMESSIDFGVSAGGIVYADIGKQTYILLLKRHDGAWVLPKGHKRVDEPSLEETARREVAEESGIPASSLEVQDLLDTYTDSTLQHAGEHKVVNIFAIRFSGSMLPKLNPDADHAEAHWWPVSTDIPPMLYPYQSTLVAEFVDRT